MSGNTAFRGGGLFLQESTLTVKGSAINGNTAGTGNGGGVLAIELATVDLREGASVSGNTASYNGGGLCLQDSTLAVNGGAIDVNSAGGGGGGVALMRSTAHLQEGASVSGNTAVDNGGGLKLQDESTLTVAGSAINDNGAGRDGGGVRAQESSTVELRDGASVSRNKVRGNGGGLSLIQTSSLSTAGRVSLRGNAAILTSSIGGAVAASTAIVFLGAGASDLSHNTAALDGGALALIEGSTLSDSGDAALGCLLTVHNNTAEKGVCVRACVVCTCVRLFVCASVRVCVRACVRTCVHACSLSHTPLRLK